MECPVLFKVSLGSEKKRMHYDEIMFIRSVRPSVCLSGLGISH